MDALAGERVQVDGQRRRQGLAFARAHFGDFAVVENHAADELNVKGAHPEHALGGFANDRKGFDHELVGRRTLGDAIAEFLGLALKLGVRELFHLRLELIDRLDLAAVLLDQAVVATAENFGEKFVKHRNSHRDGVRRTGKKPAPRALLQFAWTVIARRRRRAQMRLDARRSAGSNRLPSRKPIPTDRAIRAHSAQPARSPSPRTALRQQENLGIIAHRIGHFS